LVFACYHVSYGVGFVQGVWNFVLIRHVIQWTDISILSR
jgi:hypothetical protein